MRTLRPGEKSTEEADALARRAAELRIADREMTLVMIAQTLGVEKKTNERTANYVGQLLYRARTKLGMTFPMKPSQPKMTRGSPDRRDKIAVVWRELGVIGLAKWVCVSEERARILIAGAIPSDDEQVAIDKAFAIARVRLLDCRADDFARFSVFARRNEKTQLREMMAGMIGACDESL